MAVKELNGKLYIACHLPEGASNAGTTSSAVAVVDTASGNKVTKISLVNGSQGVKDLAFSEDGKYLYTVSVISRYEYPTTQLQDGWVNTNGINVIDVAGGKPVTAVLLDDADYGAANPYGIVVKNGKLAVTLAGHDQLMVVDEAKMRAALEKVTATNDSKRIAAVADDLTFLSGMKTRIDLKGKGPRALALYNNKVVIGDYFSARWRSATFPRRRSPRALFLSATALRQGKPESARLYGTTLPFATADGNPAPPATPRADATA